MTVDQLRTFVDRTGATGCYARVAKALFPTRPKGYRRAADALAHYAWNRIAADVCRTAGRPDDAAMYERIADDIYSAAPQYARDLEV